jgi:hypothetical protein
MMSTTLIELTFSDTHTVDCDAGVIRGVRVLGRQSRNGREYSDRALAEAAALYQGIGVNLNHPERHETNRERPVEAGFGWLEAVEVKADGVYADLHYLRSHPQAAVIVEAAQRNPKRFGLSHNAEGRLVRRGEKNVVESVEKVRSVDVVQNPATNSGLFESKDKTMPMRSVREVFQEHDQPIASLFEDGTLAPYGDATVDLPEDADASSRVAAAFKATIGAVLEDGSLAVDARLARIREILDAHQGPALRGDAPADTALIPAIPAPPVAESAGDANSDPTVRQLLERLDRLETEATCRALLESHGRSCDVTRLKALAALPTEDDRVKLIESWPDRASSAAGRIHPRPVVSRPLNETSETVSLPKDARSLALALR